MALPLGRGGSSAYGLGPPTNTFANAAARDTYANANAAWLAEYNANRFFWIRTGTNIQRRNAAGNGWENVTAVVQGRTGPGASDAQVRTQLQAGVKPYARTGGPVVPQNEIDAAILRDNEVTQSFLLNILTLTAQELNDLFVGAIVTGAGASRVIAITQTDGSTITLAVPDVGTSDLDGHVTRGAFAADGTTLTLTLSTGGTISIGVPAALRNAGLSQSQVQALIDAAEADDIDAADVASQISAALTAYRRFANVVIASSNTVIPASARDSTYVHTGSSNIRYTLPQASGQNQVPDGFELVITNQGAGDLTIDPAGGDTINGQSTLVLADLHRTVRIQKIANSAWITLSDTKDEVGSGGGGGDEGTGTIPDNSISPQKARANTAVQKRDWRERIEAAHISAGTNLLALDDVNIDDVRILTAAIASGISFRDVLDQSVLLTAAEAGDVLMVFDIRNVKTWIRVGNILTGSPALRQLISEANARAVAAQLSVDTVITINKPLFSGVLDGQNVDINIEHPIGAYAGADTIALELQGRTSYGITAYNPNLPRQTIQVGLTAIMLTNLNDNGALDAGDFVWAILRLQTGTSSASAVFRRNINIPVVAPAAGIPRFTAKSATPGASRTWTYTLGATDTEIWIGVDETETGGTDMGLFSRVIPRAMLSSVAKQIVIDHRNPADTRAIPDNDSIGVAASISGNTLTLNSTGWLNDVAPIVLSK